MEEPKLYSDVVVVGAGNAALTAALTSAAEAVAQVLVLERASPEERGGNSRFTGGMVHLFLSVSLP